MRYFQRLAENAPLTQLAHAVQLHRSFMVGDVDELMLREGMTDMPAMASVSGSKNAALTVMQAVGGVALGTMFIERIRVGKKSAIPQMVEYLMVLQGQPGCLFTCDDETVNMVSGEIWWFDRARGLNVSNNSKDDTILIGIDIRIDA